MCGLCCVCCLSAELHIAENYDRHLLPPGAEGTDMRAMGETLRQKARSTVATLLAIRYHRTTTVLPRVRVRPWHRAMLHCTVCMRRMTTPFASASTPWAWSVLCNSGKKKLSEENKLLQRSLAVRNRKTRPPALHVYPLPPPSLPSQP